MFYIYMLVDLMALAVQWRHFQAANTFVKQGVTFQCDFTCKINMNTV